MEERKTNKQTNERCNAGLVVVNLQFYTKTGPFSQFHFHLSPPFQLLLLLRLPDLMLMMMLLMVSADASCAPVGAIELIAFGQAKPGSRARHEPRRQRPALSLPRAHVIFRVFVRLCVVIRKRARARCII